MIENHFELVASCLIPFPAEFAKVGGVWETKSNKSIQIKNEFNKFCDLISYEIVSYDVNNKKKRFSSFSYNLNSIRLNVNKYDNKQSAINSQNQFGGWIILNTSFKNDEM